MTNPAFNPDDAFGLLRSYSRHIRFVQLALTLVTQEIERRALVHDASKMLDDEFAGFARINAAARINKFGSPEYAEGMKREHETIDKHFARNPHHAEYYADATDHLVNHGRECTTACGMTFLDIIEMVCDWWGAQRGYDDNKRTWEENVELNLTTKGEYLTAEQKWLVREVAAFLRHQPITNRLGVTR